MLGSICNFFHFSKHYKFLQAITALTHTAIETAHADGTRVPSLHRWLFSKSHINIQATSLGLQHIWLDFPITKIQMHPKLAVSLGQGGVWEKIAGMLPSSLSACSGPVKSRELSDTFHSQDCDIRQGDLVTSSPSEGQRKTRQPCFWSNRALTASSWRWDVFWQTSSISGYKDSIPPKCIFKTHFCI